MHWENTRVILSRGIERFETGRRVKKNSNLITLHPFVGKDGLMRVGGRLQAAVLD
jgi:hypothetical protein